MLEATLGSWQAESSEASKLLEDLYAEMVLIRQASAALEDSKDPSEAAQAAREAEEAASEARRAADEVRTAVEAQEVAARSLAARLEATELAANTAAATASTASAEAAARHLTRLGEIAADAEAVARREARIAVSDTRRRGSTSGGGLIDSASGRRFEADLDDLRSLVEEAARTYVEGDRIGEFDHALAAAGAQVVHKLSSDPYTPPGRVVPTWLWHAVGRDAGIGGPEDAITDDLAFGSCFAFAGKTGRLTVRLADGPVKPTSVSLEHLHGALCNPVANKNCSSAPSAFAVFGRRSLEDDEKPAALGRFRYEANSPNKPALQNFRLEPTDDSFSYVTLDVSDNHGHPNYTCVYRFRLHGQPP